MAHLIGLHGHPETWALRQVRFTPVTPQQNSVSEYVVEFQGVRPGDFVWVTKQLVTHDVLIGQAYVSAPDQVIVPVVGLQTPGVLGEELYTLLWLRCGLEPLDILQVPARLPVAVVEDE